MLSFRNATPRSGLPAVAVLMLVPALSTPELRAFDEPRPWCFRDGDRIVLVGDTLIERDQRYGYLETCLTLLNPNLNLTFRNLGWSGDTVAGLSRAGFDPPEAGFKTLTEQILAARPTVVIVGYGMADSFAGEAGLPAFVAALNRLLEAIAPAKARLVFLSPILHENLGPPLPDPMAHNRALALYAEAIRKVGNQHGGRYVDLLDWFEADHEPAWHFTDNGIHLNARGYRTLADAICFRLGQQNNARERGALALRRDGKVLEARRTQVLESAATAGGIRLVVKDLFLPYPEWPREPDAAPRAGETDLRVTDLLLGNHLLKIDGNEIHRGSEAEWDKGVWLGSSPERQQVEDLRRKINVKNLLFFYRWRPQNMTYLFGFRKHEQGNNAVEIPKFDPLVEEKEREIARLRKPVPHVYELVRESEVAK